MLKTAFHISCVDQINDQPSLYELLLQRELMADKMDADRGHFVVRKSDRSPSLRYFTDKLLSKLSFNFKILTTF